MNTSFLAIAIAIAWGAIFVIVNWGIKMDKDLSRRVGGVKPEGNDVNAMREGRCPDCGASELLAGPSGGISQNIGCNNCLMEFNVHHGFGSGPFGVDRTGKMSESRAAIFGIQAEEYREIVARQEKADG